MALDLVDNTNYLTGFQIKALCLRMTCAIILERRPISIITKAIDVLVTSYSYCMRVENAFQGGNRSSKRTENSSGQIANSSNFVSAESSGERIIRRKSIIEVAENKSKQSMTGGSDDENVNHAGNSDVKGSFNSLSDGDDNPNLDAMKIRLGESLGNFLSTDFLLSNST